MTIQNLIGSGNVALKAAKNVYWYFWSLWRKFSTTEFYWTARYYLLIYPNFYLRTRYYLIKEWLINSRRKPSFFFSFLAYSADTLIWALIVFLLAINGSFLLSKWFPNIYFKYVEIKNLFFEVFGFVKLFEDVTRFSDFMAGVAGISATFLGLYYTALSIGLEQKFERISDRLRLSVLNEEYGNAYLKFLTVLTSSAVLFWARAVIFGKVSFVGILFVAFMSLMLVGSSWKIIKSTFFSATPTRLSRRSFNRLYQSMRRFDRNAR